MSTFKEELARIMEGKDEATQAEAFQQFCAKYAESLPLPGQDRAFDRAMWAASEFTALSKKDEGIVSKVVGRLIGSESEVIVKAALKLKDLVGQGKQAAIDTWQDMLAAMAWQQMVPAGATRGVGAQMISLGTYKTDVASASVQMNLGWLVDNDKLRVLLQAKDCDENAIPNVELRIREAQRGIVYSCKTNEDGAVVAPEVTIAPGQYVIQIVFQDETKETPYFVV